MSVRKSVKVHADDDDFIFTRSTSFSDIDDLSDMGDELEKLEDSAKELVEHAEQVMTKTLKPSSKKSIPLFAIIAVLIPIVVGIALWQSKPSYIMKTVDGKQQVCMVKLLLHVLLVSVVLWGVMWVISKAVSGGCRNN